MVYQSSQTSSFAPQQVFAYSETNQRENNEDSFQVITITPTMSQRIPLLCVADGMGGHEHGELVSREVLQSLGSSLFSSLSIARSLNFPPEEIAPVTLEELGEAISDGIYLANQRIQRIVEQNHWQLAGSTLVIAAILDDTVIAANLGDSPLFHYQADSKQVRKVTDDHTVAGILLKVGMISDEMARHHEGRNRLQYFVGCADLPREIIPVHTFSIAPEDILLLCSDGVSGSLSTEELTAIFTIPTASLSELAERLIAAAQEKGETDNQTLILWSGRDRTPDTMITKPQIKAKPWWIERG